MRLMNSRIRLLAGSALGLGLTMVAAQPAQADLVCVFGVTHGVECTDPNGDGFTDVTFTGSRVQVWSIRPRSSVIP